MPTVLERSSVSNGPIDEADALRADMYALIGTLLSAAPQDDALAAVANLEGDDSAIGRAVAALAETAAKSSAKDVAREYDVLFIGLGRGALLPYASYYLTGFLNEKPLAVLRGHMGELGIERSADVSEPEDHIASLCEMMAGLIRGAFGPAQSPADQEAFFNTHLALWAGHFFADLESARSARFYSHVGRIGRHFMEIEIEAFRMLR